jgi:hypothetical protein
MQFSKKPYFRIKMWTALDADGNPTRPRTVWGINHKTNTGVLPNGKPFTLHSFTQVKKDGDKWYGNVQRDHIVDGDMLITIKPAVMNNMFATLQLA